MMVKNRIKLKAWELTMFEVQSPCYGDQENHLVHTYAVILFPNSYLATPLKHMQWNYLLSVKSKDKKTRFCISPCSRLVQILHSTSTEYTVLPWKLQLEYFFLTTVTGTAWELCLKNITNSLYHASVEKGIVLAQLIKSIYLFDNLQLLAICRCRWITSLIVSVSIPKDSWYGVMKNIFPKRYY